MFLSNSYKFCKGYIVIQVEGFFTERFINLCSLRGVTIWDVDRKTDGLIELKIFDKDIEKVYLILRDTRTSMKIQRRVGIPNIIRLYKKRWYFVTIACICACIIYCMSLHIWNIEILSSGEFSRDIVLKMLSDENIRIGRRIDEIEFENAKNNIYIKNDDVLWINFSLKGVTLVVEVLKRNNPQNDEFQDIPTNIVADKDGIIEKISIRNGTGLVDVGDVVYKGEIIVSGVMDSEYSDPVMVNSDADIEIKVWHTGKIAIPYKKSILFKTGNEECEYKVKLGNYTINLLNNSTKFEKYDKMLDVKKLVIFNRFEMPIEVETTTYSELISKDIFYEKNQAEIISKVMAYDLAKSKASPDAIVVDCEYSTFHNENEVITRATLECIEMCRCKT